MLKDTLKAFGIILAISLFAVLVIVNILAELGFRWGCL